MTKLLQVAPTDLTVLITGETGTGKEVFAHALHELSTRKKAPFISVNCGAIPETLLESELFGAEKGAYTGATEQRKGFFEAANHGSIFLDEIGEMPVGTQVKLLRILESGEFSRLGSSVSQKVDVRLIAATNRDLLYDVRRGRFRQDLYFRLNSVNIHLLPLRKHADDIPALVDYFAQRTADRNHLEYQGIDPEALQVLEQLPWHGNIRELRNVIETLVTLEQGAHITRQLLSAYLPKTDDQPVENPRALVKLSDIHYQPETADMQTLYRTLLQLAGDVSEMKNVLRHLLSLTFEHQGNGVASTPMNTETPPGKKTEEESISSSESLSSDLNLGRIERVAIEMALRRTQGSRREAARLLGISERTLYRKIDEYNLQ
ncbi:MAG: sigma-54-dependent Fis family transcriptional regulator [Ignavibacteria bacterium]|nr:sigma-54-dependent Fis family transcriptional regulator [Ignavibacteria bacterium]